MTGKLLPIKANRPHPALNDLRNGSSRKSLERGSASLPSSRKERPLPVASQLKPRLQRPHGAEAAADWLPDEQGVPRVWLYLCDGRSAWANVISPCAGNIARVAERIPKIFHRGRTKKNDVGDDREETRTFVGLIVSQ